jgi:hypothetical protein
MHFEGRADDRGRDKVFIDDPKMIVMSAKRPRRAVAASNSSPC